MIRALMHKKNYFEGNEIYPEEEEEYRIRAAETECYFLKNPLHQKGAATSLKELCRVAILKLSLSHENISKLEIPEALKSWLQEYPNISYDKLTIDKSDPYSLIVLMKLSEQVKELLVGRSDWCELLRSESK